MTLPTVTPADAGNYFLKTPRNAEWVAIAAGDQQIWLHEAERQLSWLCLDQAKECCGKKLADVWTEIVSELALAMQKNPTWLSGNTSGGGQIKSASLGDLSVTYMEPKTSSAAGSGDKIHPKAPLILHGFPWLLDMLGCFMTKSYGSSRVISRCC